jgi:hypothetical protein
MFDASGKMRADRWRLTTGPLVASLVIVAGFVAAAVPETKSGRLPVAREAHGASPA